MFLLAVISPNVEVEVLQSEPYLAGTLLEMQCSISLDDTIDTEVEITVAWQKDGRELNEQDRVRALPVHSVESSRYDSLLQFTTLSSDTDDGMYTCMGTVIPSENRNYITSSTESAALSISVKGILIWA